MESIAASSTENSAQEKSSQIFSRGNAEAPTAGVTGGCDEGAGMVQDPECDVRALCRVLSDEESSLFQAGRKCGDSTWRKISGNCNDE